MHGYDNQIKYDDKGYIPYDAYVFIEPASEGWPLHGKTIIVNVKDEPNEDRFVLIEEMGQLYQRPF